MITQFVTAILQALIAVRVFKFKPDYRYLSTLLIFLTGVLLISHFSKQIFENWIFNFTTMIIASILLAMVLRLLNIKGFIQILQGKETL